MKMTDNETAAFLYGEINPEDKDPDENECAVPVRIEFPDVILEGSLGNSVLELGRVCGYNFELPSIPSGQRPSCVLTWDKKVEIDVPSLCFSECPLAPDPFFFVSNGKHWLECLPAPAELVAPDFWNLGDTYRFIRNNVCSPFVAKGKGRRVLLVFQECNRLHFDPFEVVRRYLPNDHFLVLGFTEAAQCENFMNVNLLCGFFWETSQFPNPVEAMSDCAALITTSDLFVPLGIASGLPVAVLHESAFAPYDTVLDCYRHPELLGSILDFAPQRQSAEKIMTYLCSNFLVDCSSATRMIRNSLVRDWVNGTGREERAVELLIETVSHLNDEELFELAKRVVETGDSAFWKDYLSQVESLISMHGKGWSKCRQKTLRSLFAKQATRARA